MAVLMVEIFAHAPDDVGDAAPAPAWVACQFRRALAPLAADPAGVLPLIGYAVTPYDGAALVEAQCLSPSGTWASDVLAARLEAAMDDHPAAFDGWQLFAGRTQVQMSDN